MKKYFIFAAAVAFTACTQDTLIDDSKVADTKEVAIGFGTGMNNITRAENSSVTDKSDLETYQYQFKVYGYKYVSSTETPVFNGQLVQWSAGQADPFLSAGDWFYAPVRYWDKAATSYSFYACTPATAPVDGDPTFTFDTTTKKFSLSEYMIDGKSLAQNDKVTGQPNDIFAPNNDITKNRDYMIATDVTGYTTYTRDRVQLDFNHILSRFNMAVKTTIPASTATVTLKELSINNMPGQGDFNEGATITTGTLANGTAERWTTDNVNVKFGYLGSNDIYLTAGDATATINGDYNYVYQGLVIPQKLTSGTVALDGADIASVTTPYLMIKYEIKYVSGETETNVAYYDLASLFQNGTVIDTKGHKACVAAGGNVYTDGTKFYAENSDTELQVVYMDANGGLWKDVSCENASDDATNNSAQAVILLDANKKLQYAKRGNADVTFCEGWQNNLMITIDPIAILFDASVYKWDTKENVEVTVE